MAEVSTSTFPPHHQSRAALLFTDPFTCVFYSRPRNFTPMFLCQKLAIRKTLCSLLACRLFNMNVWTDGDGQLCSTCERGHPAFNGVCYRTPPLSRLTCYDVSLPASHLKQWSVEEQASATFWMFSAPGHSSKHMHPKYNTQLFTASRLGCVDLGSLMVTGPCPHMTTALLKHLKAGL